MNADGFLGFVGTGAEETGGAECGAPPSRIPSLEGIFDLIQQFLGGSFMISET